MVKGVQGVEPSFEYHRQAGNLEGSQQCGAFTEDQHDFVLLMQLFKDRDPLLELVKFRTSIAEIDNDFGFDVAAIKFFLEPVPTFSASNPLTCCLPGMRTDGDQSCLADQVLHIGPFEMEPDSYTTLRQTVSAPILRANSTPRTQALCSPIVKRVTLLGYVDEIAITA